MIKVIALLVLNINAVSVAHGQIATIIKSPSAFPSDDTRVKVFLGGSIDMGKTENWQAKLEKDLSEYDVIILNPRRDDWSQDWKPVSSDQNFREQVEWELAALEYSDIIVMYFAPDSKSPVSLLEFGLYARTGKLLVFCPEGFWRKGNVDIVSERYGLRNFETFEEVVGEIKKQVEPKT